MRRDGIRLLRDALLAIDKDPHRTSIYFTLKTSTPVYKRLFQALLNTNMIEPCDAGYRVTDKGRRFIETTNKLEEMIK